MSRLGFRFFFFFWGGGVWGGVAFLVGLFKGILLFGV